MKTIDILLCEVLLKSGAKCLEEAGCLFFMPRPGKYIIYSAAKEFEVACIIEKEVHER